MSKQNIREVPVSGDVLKKSAAEVMANPPKFPLINGVDQVIGELIRLTENSELKWLKHEFSGQSCILYRAVHKGIVFDVAEDFFYEFRVQLLDALGCLTQENYFKSTRTQELIVAIEKSNPEIVDLHNFVRDGRLDLTPDEILKFIWDTIR